MSNDDFLSILIYNFIKLNPKNIFLNEESFKLFRYKKKLIEGGMFVLTNLNGALTFLEELTINDLPDGIKDCLTESDYHLFKNKISETIILPVDVSYKDDVLTINNIDLIESNSKKFSWNNFICEPKTMETTDCVIRNTLHEDGKSVLGCSLGHISK